MLFGNFLSCTVLFTVLVALFIVKKLEAQSCKSGQMQLCGSGENEREVKKQLNKESFDIEKCRCEAVNVKKLSLAECNIVTFFIDGETNTKYQSISAPDLHIDNADYLYCGKERIKKLTIKKPTGKANLYHIPNADYTFFSKLNIRYTFSSRTVTKSEPRSSSNYNTCHYAREYSTAERYLVEISFNRDGSVKTKTETPLGIYYHGYYEGDYPLKFAWNSEVSTSKEPVNPAFIAILDAGKSKWMQDCEALKKRSTSLEKTNEKLPSIEKESGETNPKDSWQCIMPLCVGTLESGYWSSKDAFISPECSAATKKAMEWQAMMRAKCKTDEECKQSNEGRSLTVLPPCSNDGLHAVLDFTK